jgi:hypothetical protein
VIPRSRLRSKRAGFSHFCDLASRSHGMKDAMSLKTQLTDDMKPP